MSSGKPKAPQPAADLSRRQRRPEYVLTLKHQAPTRIPVGLFVVQRRVKHLVCLAWRLVRRLLCLHQQTQLCSAFVFILRTELHVMQSVRVNALLWGGFACPVSASLASATVRRVLLLRLAELQTRHEMDKIWCAKTELRKRAWPQQPLPFMCSPCRLFELALCPLCRCLCHAVGKGMQPCGKYLVKHRRLILRPLQLRLAHRLLCRLQVVFKYSCWSGLTILQANPLKPS